jgi:hypothetical protein
VAKAASACGVSVRVPTDDHRMNSHSTLLRGRVTGPTDAKKQMQRTARASFSPSPRELSTHANELGCGFVQNLYSSFHAGSLWFSPCGYLRALVGCFRWSVRAVIPHEHSTQFGDDAARKYERE